MGLVGEFVCEPALFIGDVATGRGKPCFLDIGRGIIKVHEIYRILLKPVTGNYRKGLTRTLQTLINSCDLKECVNFVTKDTIID